MKSEMLLGMTRCVVCYAGCASVKDARQMADAIDGDDGVSWHLPLPPLNSSSLEPYSPGIAPSDCCVILLQDRITGQDHRTGSQEIMLMIHIDRESRDLLEEDCLQISISESKVCMCSEGVKMVKSKHTA